MEHSTYAYSLNEAKEELRYIPKSGVYHEGKLTACFHYLNEYENRLNLNEGFDVAANKKLIKDCENVLTQKILIGENISFYTTDAMIKLLVAELGKTPEFWNNFCYRHPRLIRLNKSVQDAFAKVNFTLMGEFSENDVYKVIEIPIDVKWGVQDYECASGEFIFEVHRIWN